MVSPVYKAKVLLQVQQVLMVSTDKELIKDMNVLSVSIENEGTTTELLNQVSRANISVPKKVSGVLVVEAVGEDKKTIREDVLESVKLIKDRHAKIFNVLSKNGVLEVLPAAIMGEVLVSEKPVSPKTGLIITVASVFGLMVGVFVALVKTAVRNRKTKINE
jgi:capsular polysaccharide biosynthesis protein